MVQSIPATPTPSPFSAFSGALGLTIDDEHKFDAAYVTNLISEKLAEYGENGRVGGWEVSYVRCEMEFLFRYAMAYCEGAVNEVDGLPDAEFVDQLMKDIYTDTVKYSNYSYTDDGTVFENWFAVSRDLYGF